MTPWNFFLIDLRTIKVIVFLFFTFFTDAIKTVEFL